MVVACRIIVSVPVPFLWTLGFGTWLDSYKISSFHLQGDSGGPLTAYKKVKGPRGRTEYRAFLIGNYRHIFIIKLSLFEVSSVGERVAPTPISLGSTPGYLTGSAGSRSTLGKTNVTTLEQTNKVLYHQYHILQSAILKLLGAGLISLESSSASVF